MALGDDLPGRVAQRQQEESGQPGTDGRRARRIDLAKPGLRPGPRRGLPVRHAATDVTNRLDLEGAAGGSYVPRRREEQAGILAEPGDVHVVEARDEPKP